MRKTAIGLTACIALLLSCQTRSAQTEAMPAEPDYRDSTQWYVSQRGAEADIFYIISTETGDYTAADGLTCHYADTYADSLRAPLYGEMLGVDTLISGRLNFYSPYYRQCSLQSFVTDSLKNARIATPLGDVRSAFSHYLNHLNGGRPFILAGYSQGAMLMLELLKEMDDSTYERMIAAYAIGITIAQPERHIVAARGADDTGVTVSYNSVRDRNSTMPGWTNSCMAINPVNWRTDSTRATLITEPSPLLPVSAQKKDTMTVHVDTTSGLLVVEGFSDPDYILPLIGVEGCYHSREIWLYREQLRANIALRTAAYLSCRPK